MAAVAAILSILLVLLINKRRVDLENIELYQNDITSVTLQPVAYDYHVRVIKCGYGQIFINKYLPEYDVIKNRLDSGSMQTSPIELAEMLPIDAECYNNKSIKLVFNTYKNNDSATIVYFIRYRLFGKYYIAYGTNPLIAWSIVIKNARTENRKIFSRYPDRQRNN